MSQKHKNITLLGILVLLIICSIILGVTDYSSVNTIENRKIFSVQDTSKVDHISIKSKSETIQLSKVDGLWMLNDTYKAEANIVKVLLSILKDVEVIRNVPKTQTENIADHIRENGFLIEISGDENLMQTFYSSGNNNKTVSYIMRDNENNPSIINIPGYESYVAGIFEISANDWRERVILSTNWRTLQKLHIDYAEYPELSLNIKFEFNFLNVEGVTNLDTAKMMSFIDKFNYLQTDRYINKGQYERYDSLLQTPKTVSMAIEDINERNSRTIDFFPLIPDDPMMLGYVKEDDQMVLFEANRIQKIFAVKSDFEAKPENSQK